MSVCQVPQKSKDVVAPVLAGVFGSLALGMVIVRIWQRTIFKPGFGWDDGLIIAALLCSGPLNIMMFPLYVVGLGRNMWTLSFDNITKVFQYMYIAEVFYMPAEALTQLSFLFFYIRVFPTKSISWIAYVLIVVSIMFGISNTFVMIFQTTPVTFFWNGWTGEYKGTSIQINDYSWYKAAMQIVTDLCILSLPIHPLMGLSLTLKKKARIFLMFCAGFLITVVSCLRLQSLIKFAKSTNATYDNAPAVYWSVVECDIAIICACMPFLPSLLQSLFPSIFGELSNKQAYDGSAGTHTQWSSTTGTNSSSQGRSISTGGDLEMEKERQRERGSPNGREVAWRVANV
ncbi:hypothetical protein PHISCL_05550 [Aspergillus sclerotialis]|uniref:Rhodopsin domain-containing protein n=1 Tax=Aspergillus sclerotialis TaxID=2070753 RepID=A0A3A2ZYG9_9EURO|nr:hypothetical protein PHISCL_05550 [Aspergillus sclerotialis]